MPAHRAEHAAGAVAASKVAKHTRKQVGRDIRYREQLASGAIAGPPIGGGRCWCGCPYDHPWSGKADGAPHPR